MSRIHPECFDPNFSDRSEVADLLLRDEPDEEDEEEDNGKDDEDEEDTDDGYSE